MVLKLLLPPDQDGYTVEDGNNVVKTDVAGGASRYRRDHLGSAMKVEVTWTLEPSEYQYLRAFYNNINKGADAFALDLLIDAFELRTYICRFRPGTFKLSRVKGASFQVKATLDVDPNDQGLDYAQIVQDFTVPEWSAPPPPVDWGVE